MAVNVAKLKKRAAEFEAKRQFDKALAVYIEMLDVFDQNADELDVALFNRVGDLLLKQGQVADAVDYYERAVDKYAEGGFFNNAIALCNKILRQSPGRSSVYYKLGKISAQKGFKADAKQNFLEYADRMQKSGRMDEAFRALKEFADLCPDQDDIRLMLAEQLSRQERGKEAVEQLQTLFDRYSAEGRAPEAQATLDRIKAIDPAYEPRTTGQQRRQKSDDLVFLDVYGKEAEEAAEAPRAAAPAPAAAPAKAAPKPAPAPAPAPPPAPPQPEAPAIEHGDSDLLGVDFTASVPGVTPTPMGGIETTQLSGLESTNLGDSAPPDDSGTLLDLEPTSFGDSMANIPAIPEPGIEPTAGPAAGAAPEAPEVPTEHDVVPPAWVPHRVPRESASMTPIDFEPIDLDQPAAAQDETIGGDLEFILPDEPRTAPSPRASGEILDEMIPPMLREDRTSSPQVDIGDLEIVSSDDLPPAAAPSFPARPSREVRPSAGVPLMDLAVPEPPVVDHQRISQAQQIPELSLAEELEEAEEPEVPTPADEEAIPEVPPQRARRSTLMAALSVETLAAAVEGAPDDHGLRRQLGEMMLESGNRDGGMRELESAMTGFERGEDLGSAASVADELGRLDPDSVRIQQKRVEYAFRTSDRTRLLSAYLDLGAALLSAGQPDKARSIYQRVLELDPDEVRASEALATIAPPEPPPAPVADASPAAPGMGRRSVAQPPVSAPPQAAARAAAPVTSRPEPEVATDDFVNLGDWLREDDGPKSTRMVTAEEEPTGDEEADFAEMLRKFKQGVAENVDAEDHQSHYDLGVAFKEMGLLDEAIAEFQKALRAPSNRLPTYEALGQCFVDKEQYPVAQAILGRALNENGATDEQLIGVLYLLGRAAEGAGKYEEASGYYQRVFVIDIQFRDVAERLNAVEQTRR
jgi:tetratricopeptide (TPR) repeat protein